MTIKEKTRQERAQNVLDVLAAPEKERRPRLWYVLALGGTDPGRMAPRERERALGALWAYIEKTTGAHIFGAWSDIEKQARWEYSRGCGLSLDKEAALDLIELLERRGWNETPAMDLAYMAPKWLRTQSGWDHALFYSLAGVRHEAEAAGLRWAVVMREARRWRAFYAGAHT